MITKSCGLRSAWAGSGRSRSGKRCRRRCAIPLAARAWIAEWGDPGRALVRLGFPAMNRLPPDKVGLYKDYTARVFETPGVQAILRRDLSRLDADREAILARQLRTALYGEDAESVRAAALLAKVCGWEFRTNPISTVAV